MKKKSCRLLLPYLIITIVWAIPFLGLYTKITKEVVIQNYVLAVSSQQLWFLRMLFWVFIIERFVFEKIHNSVIKFVAALFLWELGFLGGVFVPNYFQIFNGIQYYLFFLIGMKMKDCDPFIVKIPTHVYGMLHILLLIGKNIIVFGDSVVGKLMDWHFSLLLHIVGAVSIFLILDGVFTRYKDKFDKNKIWQIICQQSFTIYLFHQQIVWLILVLLFNKVGAWLIVPLSFILSIFVSVGIGLILSKWKWTRLLLGLKQTRR